MTTPMSASTGNELESEELGLIEDLLLELHDSRADATAVEHITRRLCVAILRANHRPANEWIANPNRAVTAPNTDRRVKQLAAAVFLRALAKSERIWDSQFKADVFKLFDSIFEIELYRSLKIVPTTQAFDKQAKLVHALQQLETQLQSVVSSFVSLAAFPSARQHLMQALNSAIAKAVVWQFVALEYVGPRLEAVCRGVTDYQAALGAQKYHALEKARELVQGYSSDLDVIEGAYAEVLHSFVSRIDEMIAVDFDNSSYSKPAQLVIRPSPKKYPLDSVGGNFGVLVTIENMGSGRAFDLRIEFDVSDNLRQSDSDRYVGDLDAGEVLQDVELPVSVLASESFGIVGGVLHWSNFNRTVESVNFELELVAQRVDLNWSELEARDPYSTEPVVNPDELVGRTEQLKQLLARLGAARMGSFYIFGQKRVGKTSLVYALAARLHEAHVKDFFVFYLDAGDYVHPHAGDSVERLGERLCEEIKAADKRFSKLKTPRFDKALSPLDKFLREALEKVPQSRFVFILDEFDQLPTEVYRRGHVGDAFFLTLRSLSAKPYCGFVLVGGEKMELIVSSQGEQLNKFQGLRLDYFSRDTHWTDFEELIRRPVKDALDFSDEAVKEAYDQSAGNPYFAKLICDTLFRLLVQRRDSSVTRREVAEAAGATRVAAGANVFQHFWEDGILEPTGDREEERSIQRRRVL
ncbi:MAG: ATP-binding protein, partial [Gemmatimonadota bacterium]|nr:ATP-binding protein [Gemmatimonadota bacterium]